MLRIALDAMAATSVTVLSDYGKGVLSGDVPVRLVEAARKAGRKLIVDPRGSDFARYAGRGRGDAEPPGTRGRVPHAGGYRGGDRCRRAASARSCTASAPSW